MRRAVSRALAHWVREGLLTSDHADTLRASLEGSQPDRAIRAFAVIGAVLAGLGVLLFVGSNWAAMGSRARVAVLLGAYGSAVLGATLADRKGLPRAAEAGWLLASLIFGANIFLMAQIFNHSLTYWQGPFWWMVGVLVLGWVRQSAWQAALAVPLGLLALGWIGGGEGWFFDDQLEFLVTDRGLRPILPLVGIGLVSLSLLADRADTWRFASAPAFRWGILLAAVPLVISTTHAEAAKALFQFPGSLKQILILAAVVLFTGLALMFGAFRSREGRPLVAAATIFFGLVLVQAGDGPWIASGPLPYGLYIVAVFVLALAAIWVGVRADNPRLVNVGMAGTGFLILIQYFSWTFQLLDRSLVFVGGGLLLVAVSVVLERKRRTLVGGLRARAMPAAKAGQA
jgi:uncharacterized membrane protein